MNAFAANEAVPIFVYLMLCLFIFVCSYLFILCMFTVYMCPLHRCYSGGV